MIGYDLLHVNHKQSRAKKDGADEQTERLPDIAADTDGLACDFLWREGFILIDTGVQGIRVCVGHLPEGVFDDAGGVIAHAQFKKNDFLVLLGVQEGFVAVCGGVPALVLDEFVIGEQVQRCGFAAVRAGLAVAAAEMSAAVRSAPQRRIGDRVACGKRRGQKKIHRL